MRRVLACLVLAACGGTPVPVPVVGPPVAPPAAELSPALAELDWWVGDWQGKGGEEHWVASAGVIYGVAFDHEGGFEVMIVDDAIATGKLRLFAMPGGTKQVPFEQVGGTGVSVKFENPAHDDPKSIEYGRTPSGLTAIVMGSSELTFTFTPVPHVAAPELEKADLAFAAAVEKRGVEGWVAWFAPDGWMWQAAGKIEYAKIRDTMTPLFKLGQLSWAPIASGTSGSLGYTVGKGTFTGVDPKDSWKSSYVTIWKQQADGSWKVLFDTGRGVDEP
jgi:ketosteroid isomerase-like protein